jgi:hypothetical protein
MTDEQLNAAIAEACGWTEIQDSGVWHHHKLWGYPPLKPGQGGNSFHYLPNYCNDLNAMHEAEKTIFPYYATVYSNKLAQVTGAEMSDDTDYFCATARQRAEAFLRTLGKWKATDKGFLTVGGATTEEFSADHLRDGTEMMEEVKDAPQ